MAYLEQIQFTGLYSKIATVLRIRIHRIHMFLGLLDPDADPLLRFMDPDPDPSTIKQKE